MELSSIAKHRVKFEAVLKDAYKYNVTIACDHPNYGNVE